MMVNDLFKAYGNNTNNGEGKLTVQTIIGCNRQGISVIPPQKNQRSHFPQESGFPTPVLPVNL